MANDGLKNQELVGRILQQGSKAINTKNEAGVYTFSGSNATDGIIVGQLLKPKYNKEELEKSVDVVIEELLPIQAPEAPDTVPRPTYNEVTQSVVDLVSQVNVLTNIALTLQTKVSEVEIVSESLRVELDSKDLVVAASENQTQQSTDRIQTIVSQLQNAIQKATAESIQRVSFAARAESLQQEVDLLREQLFGKQAQLEAGAKSSGTAFTVKTSPIGDATQPPIRGSQRFVWSYIVTAVVARITRGLVRKKLENRSIQFVNGDTITVRNSLEEPITITFERSGVTEWFKINGKGGDTKIELQPQETKQLQLTSIKDWTTERKQQAYKGALILSTVLSNNVEESVTIEVKIQRYK